MCCLCGTFYVLIYLVIPATSIIFRTSPFSIFLPRRGSDPGSLSRLLLPSPLRYVRALIFVARTFRLCLPSSTSSTRFQLCVELAREQVGNKLASLRGIGLVGLIGLTRAALEVALIFPFFSQ